MSKRLRIAFLALAALLLIGAAIVQGVVTKSSGSARLHHGSIVEAFAKHSEEAFAARVGETGGESPVSAADELFMLNAYPADDIASAQISGAKAAWHNLQQQGQHETSNWKNLGPTGGLYPAFLNRHGSDYMASGRIKALVVSPSCAASKCTLWVATAGGGVWRTDTALSANASWKNVSDGWFASGAVGALTLDAAHNTIYAGTGEDAAAGDAEAGVGVYKSTDGGNTWTALGGNANFTNRAIRQISVDQNDSTGNTIYVADGRGVHGISSTTAGAVSQIPGAPGVGVWKSSDGGATFTQLQHSTVVLGPNPGQTFESTFGSTRGATSVQVDPTHAGIIYATAYNKGLWRSIDNGATWTNIHPCQTCGGGASRSEFALATTPDSHTRVYQTEGDTCSVTSTNPCTSPVLTSKGTGYSRLWVADAAESGAPTFVDKTSPNRADPGYATWNFCTGQCWYDQYVYSPKGQPNTVYIGGSYTYGEDHGVSNARAVLLSRDGGNTFTDQTDAAAGTDASHDGLHPDQHALITNPNNPLQYWEGSDGGLMLSNGTLADASGRCDGRPLGATSLARCKQLLSAVPGAYTNLNKGLATLQFQSLSVNPRNPQNVQGGTQDNGTFETQGSRGVWPQTIFGDGGLSGFDASNNAFRFHTYFIQQVDVSFQSGAPPSWDWIADPLFTGESALFYFPIISDPVVSKTMYAGLNHVWRTKTDGVGTDPLPVFESHCNEFTGDGDPAYTCGDWVKLDGLSLTTSARGTRAGGNVSWISRATTDSSTLWASTTGGRVFISKNADAEPASAVTFTRLDTLATNSPNRAVSSISVDPANSNHVYISYLGYNAVTPLTPGHVFSVTYDPIAGTATWTSIEGSGSGVIGDQPVNAVAYDNVKGDLYLATDFGVLKMPNGGTAWEIAGQDLPIVTVAGLTMNSGARQLLAATHGRSAYQLPLPSAGGGGNNH